MKAWNKVIFFTFLFCFPIMVFSQYASEEVWYTNKALNQDNGNAFNDFMNLLKSDIIGENEIAGATEIDVVFAFDDTERQTKMTRLEISYAGRSNPDRLEVNDPGKVPDVPVRVLQYCFSDQETSVDPRLMENYPIFVRKEEVFLSREAGAEEVGTDSFVFDKKINPDETRRFIDRLNEKLNLGIALNDEDISDYQIVMTTKGSGRFKRLINLKFLKEGQEVKTLKGSEVNNAFKSGREAGELGKELWLDSYKQSSDLNLNRKNWPSKFSVRYYIKNQGAEFFMDSIIVSGIKRGKADLLYTGEQLNEISIKAGADLKGIAKNIIEKTGLEDDVRAILTNNYNVAQLPAEGTNEYDNAVENSFSLVSFVSMSINARDADDQVNKTSTDVGNDYYQFMEEDALWQKYFNLNSGYWAASTDVTVKGKDYQTNLFQLGFDNISSSINLKNHYITVGTCLGQEQLNYPFVWAGSQSLYLNWQFSKSMRDITKIVDKVSVNFRSYNPLMNELINEVEQAVDNKYLKRDDLVNRRIALNNLQFEASKTFNFSKANRYKFPQLDNIEISVPWQLPISYRETHNIGGNNNITGAAEFNNTYTYIKQFTGVCLGLNFDRETDYELGNYYLRSIGLSWFQLFEQKNNMIEDGVFHSGLPGNDGAIEYNSDNPDKVQMFFIDTQFGYPDQNTGVDKFILQWRFGVGDRWSHLVTTRMKVSGALWIDVKLAFYETKTFAYNKVFMLGPVFRINY
ncbi:MAG TPA: hypothetical protein PLP19_04180 [bacterium]|nr:hypothetical protein [bacterium]HPN42667.1 hypothetical protein [bacterium]